MSDIGFDLMLYGLPEALDTKPACSFRAVEAVFEIERSFERRAPQSQLQDAEKSLLNQRPPLLVTTSPTPSRVNFGFTMFL